MEVALWFGGIQTDFLSVTACTSGGGPLHARVPIHAHPEFS